MLAHRMREAHEAEHRFLSASSFLEGERLSAAILD
jgi:hypothetical protein